MSSESTVPPLLLVLSAPSGAGKTTLSRRLLAVEPSARLSISTTTRPPRGSEIEGREYHFVDNATFERMVDAREFVEWAVVHGHRYGTSRRVVESAVREPGSLTIFDIDVQGGAALKRQFPSAVTVFVLPPSFAVLQQRLRDRRTEGEAAIERRLAAASWEIDRGIADYDYLVVNQVIEQAIDDIRAIIRAARCCGSLRREAIRQQFGGLMEAPPQVAKEPLKKKA